MRTLKGGSSMGTQIQLTSSHVQQGGKGTRKSVKRKRGGCEGTLCFRGGKRRKTQYKR